MGRRKREEGRKIIQLFEFPKALCFSAKMLFGEDAFRPHAQLPIANSQLLADS